MKIGLLLPAYDEGKNIIAVIREAKKYLPGSEIVVVDDGSKDNTYDLARKTGVIVVRHEVNKGKGEALKTGLNFFKKRNVDSVIIADTDRQYSLQDAKFIVNGLEMGYDVVAGFRNPRQIPYANRIGNFSWRLIFNILFCSKFKDTNCGFIGMRKSVISKIDIHGGYIIENSIYASCVRNRLRVLQVPVNVSYSKRKVGKFAKMYFGVMYFIVKEGFKYRIKGY